MPHEKPVQPVTLDREERLLSLHGKLAMLYEFAFAQSCDTGCYISLEAWRGLSNNLQECLQAVQLERVEGGFAEAES